MGSHWIVAFVASACVISAAGCGSDDGASSSLTAPSPTVLNLTGTWSGTFGVPGESRPIRINSWTAAQRGANVSGALVLDAGDEGGLVNTTLTGIVSGAQLTSVTFTLAAGAIQGSPTCAIHGTGTLAATTTSVSGPLAMAITPAAAPCVGSDNGIGDAASATWTFALTKVTSPSSSGRPLP